MAFGAEALPVAPEPVHISYADEAGCSSPSEFWNSVLGRSSRIRSAAPGEPARHFLVTARADGKRLRGAVVVRDVDGQETRRDIEAGTCPELTKALSLVVALTVDSEATAAPVSVPAAPAPAAAKEPARTPRKSLAVATKRQSWSVWAIGAGGAVRDVAPGWSPAFLLGIEADLANEGRTVLQLSFAARYARSAERAEVASSGNTMHATAIAGVLAACAVRIGSARWGLMPCVGVDVGARQARGVAVDNAHRETRPTVDPAAYLQLAFQVTGALQLRLLGGARAPLLRYRYVVADSTFEVPRLAPLLGLALAVRL